MGELIGSAGKTSRNKVLSWNDIVLSNDSAILHISNPKSLRREGEFIDIFKNEGKSFCPVSALSHLKVLSTNDINFSSDQPVFLMDNYEILTTSLLNEILKDMFSDICKQGLDLISCHSFRAAVPTAVLKMGSNGNVLDIKSWGRWSSNCYTHYAKLQTGQKRKIFESILYCMLNN